MPVLAFLMLLAALVAVVPTIVRWDKMERAWLAAHRGPPKWYEEP
jgi:hypothetical protein